ncbi:MAG: MFS transporter [Clostridia bacterium]|nr:MFS transporter [Clostridia bacterium]
MGFSLEPHQEAYEAALKAEYTEPLADLTDDDAIALRDQISKLFTDANASSKILELQKGLTEEKASAPETVKVFETAVSFLAKNEDLGINNSTGVITHFRHAIFFSTILFWAMAFMVGTVQGGIQAVSRSYFGKLIPKERSNEFFGFFDIFGKFASVLGPFLYSLIGTWTGRSSYGVLALICLFLVGLVIMIRGKKDFEALDSGAEA